MKFIAVILTLVAATLAQRIAIGTPEAGVTLTAGEDTLVTVLKPNSLSGSTEIGIAILLHHCVQTPCEDASQQLGSVLYAGSFDPQPGTGFFGEPLENFTVAIPDGFASGQAVLSVAHANLIGACPELFSEIANVTVNVD